MPLTASGIAYDHEPARDPSSPRVVFIHAGIADRRMWDPQIDALRGEYDLTRLDLRGFGESATAPTGPFGHDQDVAATLKELELEGVHLVGSSYGAGVAVETALLHGDLVASLVLAPPGGSLLASLTDTLSAFFAEEEAALDAGDLDRAVEANINAWVIGAGRTADDVTPGVIDAVRTMQRRTFELGQQLGEIDSDEVDPPALERLEAISAPTLLVVGGHDMDTSIDAAEHVESGLRDVTRHDWPDVAHLPSLEQPERFTELLRDWVAAREQA